MARTPQTQAKRARELALKEKRERKQAKKAEAAARRAAGLPPIGYDLDEQSAEDQSENGVGPEATE